MPDNALVETLAMVGRPRGLEFRAFLGVGFRVQGLGFRGFRFEGLVFRSLRCLNDVFYLQGFVRVRLI